MTFRRFLVASMLALPLAAALPAMAQEYDRGYGDPPAYGTGPAYDGGGGGGDPGGYGGAAPDRSQDRSDAAGLAMRVGKLESRIREITGQIEELQNANRKLLEQLQRVQDESSSGGRTRRGDAGPSGGAERPAVAARESASREPAADEPAPRPAGKSRGDAFDPDSAPAGDPGQPKALGSAAAAAEDGGAPMDLSGGRLRRSGDGGDTIAPALRLPPRGAADAGGNGAERPVPASTGPMTPREAYDAALGYYRGKQYDDAEKGFAAFIQKNPKSRLVADATYYLGESYAQRGRSREAAEQYLKISKDFSGSARAPDAMLRLGVSMMALGAKEQACATFSEVTRKYPNAPAYVKSGAERESKRAQCG